MGDYIPTCQGYVDYIGALRGVQEKTKFADLVVSVMDNRRRYCIAEMSSDSRESLDHRDPTLFFKSQYQSRYQDCVLKSLDSCLDV